MIEEKKVGISKIDTWKKKYTSAILFFLHTCIYVLIKQIQVLKTLVLVKSEDFPPSFRQIYASECGCYIKNIPKEKKP